MSNFPASLVRLFPTAFRVQFGADIEEQILRDAAEARRKGWPAGLAFKISTAIDLLRAALAERRDPTWNSFRMPSPDGQDRETMLSGWTNDLRHAIGALRRAPGFAAVTIATLGLAIGVNVAIFGVVDAVLLNPLPFPDADRLVHIAASAPGSDFPDEFGVGNEFYLQYSERSQLLEDISTYNSFTNSLQLDDRIERVRMSWLTPSLFTTLQVTPLLGRLPVPEDEDRVVVISHRLWANWFGSDPDIIGRTVYVSGSDRTVIGVAPPDFWFPSEDTLLWMFFNVEAEGLTPGRFGSGLVARMTPAADASALGTELTGLAGQLPERFGGSENYARLIEQHRAVVRPLRDQLLGQVEGPLLILLGAVAVVLVIACANVGNLFVVRAEHRQRDLAVRRALGAGRGALVRSQMAEAVVIAAAAAIVAVVIAWFGVPAFVSVAPSGIPRISQAGLSASTFVFAFAVAALAGLACGLIPALRASAPRLTQLKESGRGLSRARHWGRDALVVGQTALALLLLISSGLLIRSFIELRQVDPGYDTENIFTFQIAPSDEHLVDAASFAQFHTDFAARIAAMPGVESVGIIENVPLDESTAGGRFLTESTAGLADAESENGSFLHYTWADGNYFATMGVEVLQGRVFQPSDHVSTLGNVIVSRRAAETLWPGQDPIGQQLQRGGLETWETVVGVVDDVMQNNFRDTPDPLVYFPLVGQPPDRRAVTSPAYVVKTTRADTIGDDIRAAVREASPTAPMYRVYTMAGLAEQSMIGLSFTMVMLGIASALALVLGAIGLFGVLSYVVAQRTREIGIRMALGAEAARVLRMVVIQGAQLLAVGVIFGIAAAAASTRLLDSLLFGVPAADLATFATMSATMVLIGLLASYLPARRASAVDPMESLRRD